MIATSLKNPYIVTTLIIDDAEQIKRAERNLDFNVRHYEETTSLNMLHLTIQIPNEVWPLFVETLRNAINRPTVDERLPVDDDAAILWERTVDGEC